MEEYPEEPGFVNEPAFVKANPLNNESYLEKCCKTYPEWADLLRETHAKLEELAPGYNIAQIKDKFGGLRYYWDCPADWRDGGVGHVLDEYTERYSQASDIVRDAEDKSYSVLGTTVLDN